MRSTKRHKVASFALLCGGVEMGFFMACVAASFLPIFCVFAVIGAVIFLLLFVARVICRKHQNGKLAKWYLSHRNINQFIKGISIGLILGSFFVLFGSAPAWLIIRERGTYGEIITQNGLVTY